MKTLKLETDAAGIAIITLDVPDKPMNVVSPQFIDEFIAAIERVAGDAAIKGAIVTSGKPAFMAGADLKYILGIAGGAMTLREAGAAAYLTKDAPIDELLNAFRGGEPPPKPRMPK